MPDRTVNPSTLVGDWLIAYNLLATDVGDIAQLAAGITGVGGATDLVEAVNYIHGLVTGEVAEFDALAIVGTASFGGAVTMAGTLAVATGITVGGGTVWHANNDGAGSGLDSDLLDGQHGSYYLAWGNLTGVPSTFTPSAHTHGAADVVSGVFDVARIPDLSTAKLTSGTLGVARGGTGLGSLTTGSFLRASSSSAFEQRTAAQVLTDIGAAAASHTHAIADVAGLQTALDTKLNSSAYTAADVLSKLLTVDGASSGLDSDLLDGQHGSYYLAWGNLTGVPSTFTPSAHTHDASSITSGVFDAARIPSLAYLPSGGGTLTGDLTISAATPLINLFENDQGAGAQWSRIYRSSNVFYIETEGTMRFTGYGGGNLAAFEVRTGNVNRVIWHSGNHGPGSGLDADTVDGVQLSALARTDITNGGNLITTGEVRGSLFRFDFNDEYLGRSGDSIIAVVNNTTRGQFTTSGLSVTGAITATGDVTGFSDSGLKKNIRPIDGALARVRSMRGVTFDWNKEAHKLSPGLAKRRHAGVIYQEVKEAFDAAAVDGAVGAVSYPALVGLLVAAVNELAQQLEELR